MQKGRENETPKIHIFLIKRNLKEFTLIIVYFVYVCSEQKTGIHGNKISSPKTNEFCEVKEENTKVNNLPKKQFIN